MIVSMWMARDLVTIGPDTGVSEAAMLMARKRIRRLLIVDTKPDGLHLLGILSAKDVLHAFPPNVNPFSVEVSGDKPVRFTVNEIMSREVRTTTPDTPIEEAAAFMCDHKIGALPVVRAGKLIGIITESDIFRAFVSLFSAEGAGARITFDATKGEDVFSLIADFATRDGVKVISLISTEEENRPVCVVRITGTAVDAVLDDLWRSGHLVLNVLRY